MVPTSILSITGEGFIAAMLITTRVSYFIYPYLTPLDVKSEILSGLIINVSGFAGSLTFSVLKRDLLICAQER